MTGYKLTQNGATQNTNVSVQADDGGAFAIFLVGQNISQLTDDNFGGSNLEISSYDSETGELVGSLTGSSSTNLVITSSATTIATIPIVPYDDNNGHPIDTGD